MTAQPLVPYRDGYDYGVGVEGATGNRMGLGVQGDIQQVYQAGGGTSSIQISKVQSMSEMEDSLGISAEASGGVGLFSASGRFDFARSSKTQSSSLTLLITDTVKCGFKQILRPVLSDPDLASNPTAFQQRYGDQFVVGMETGGVFFGYLRIDTKSDESRQTIDAAMSGSYGLAFSAQVAMKLQDALTQTGSTCVANIYYEGGAVPPENRNPQSPQDLLIAHQHWFSSVIDQNGNPTNLVAPYRALLSPYTIAQGPLPPNQADLEHQRDVLVHCAQLRSAILDRQNLTNYMLSHTEEFVSGPGDLDMNATSTLDSQFAADLDQVKAAASYALDYPAKALSPETFDADSPGNRRATNYVFATIPANIPKHTGGDLIPVPNVVGMGLEAAKALIIGAGFKYVFNSGYMNVCAFSPASSQNPGANQRARRGSDITVIGSPLHFTVH